MFIRIHDLELHEVVFTQEFQPDSIDIGLEVRQQTALRASGRAELIQEHHGARGTIEDIRVVGDFSTRIEMKCARCLDPVVRDLASTFDLLYRPLGVDAGVEERSVQEVDAGISYYQGDGLLLEDVLREQVLLAVPIKAVCREECKGLCPRCGRNLNFEACVCPEPLTDLRWAALKDIKDKLQG